jgi:hypothetical protein
MTGAATPETATAPEDTTLAAAAAAIERPEERRRRADAPAGEADPAEPGEGDPAGGDAAPPDAEAEAAETDVAGRERRWLALRLLRQLRGQLREAVTTGRLAALGEAAEKTGAA